MFSGLLIRIIKSVLLVFSFTSAFCQLTSESVKSSTIEVGNSAISIHTLSAHLLTFQFPISGYGYDSSSKLLFVTGHQKSEPFAQALQRNFFLAIHGDEDQVKWFMESSLNSLDLVGNQLILSNESRSVRYNKKAGYDEMRYPKRIHFYIPGTSLGIAYSNQDLDTVVCIDLNSGLIKWKSKLSGKEDWADYSMFGDSTLLIVSEGLHAFHLRKGLLWYYPLETSVLTNKSLVYSLAKHKSIENISKVVHSTGDENMVSQLASNIWIKGDRIYLASKTRCVALDSDGKEIWTQDLRNYPISKMLLTTNGNEIVLINFGLALHSARFVRWGQPFIITLNPENGNLVNQYDLSKIDNLADFIQLNQTIVFAGKDEIMKISPGEPDLKSVLNLSENKYGKFTEFINGNEYYTLKEGYYVPLNFINDNLVYFRTDNNKIYGIDGDVIQYEYHFTDLFKLEKTFDDKTLLSNDKGSVIISKNFELLFEINLTEPAVVSGEKLFFIEDNRLIVLNKSSLK